MRTLLSVAALALLASCASKPTTSKPLTLDQKLEKSGYELGGEIDKIQSWNVDSRDHGSNAVGDESGLGHQAGAEAAALHPVARAAEVEVDQIGREECRERGCKEE